MPANRVQVYTTSLLTTRKLRADHEKLQGALAGVPHDVFDVAYDEDARSRWVAARRRDRSLPFVYVDNKYQPGSVDEIVEAAEQGSLNEFLHLNVRQSVDSIALAYESLEPEDLDQLLVELDVLDQKRISSASTSFPPAIGPSFASDTTPTRPLNITPTHSPSNSATSAALSDVIEKASVNSSRSLSCDSPSIASPTTPTAATTPSRVVPSSPTTPTNHKSPSFAFQNSSLDSPSSPHSQISSSTSKRSPSTKQQLPIPPTHKETDSLTTSPTTGTDPTPASALTSPVSRAPESPAMVSPKRLSDGSSFPNTPTTPVTASSSYHHKGQLSSNTLFSQYSSSASTAVTTPPTSPQFLDPTTTVNPEKDAEQLAEPEENLNTAKAEYSHPSVGPRMSSASTGPSIDDLVASYGSHNSFISTTNHPSLDISNNSDTTATCATRTSIQHPSSLTQPDNNAQYLLCPPKGEYEDATSIPPTPPPKDLPPKDITPQQSTRSSPKITNTRSVVNGYDDLSTSKQKNQHPSKNHSVNVSIGSFKDFNFLDYDDSQQQIASNHSDHPTNDVEQTSHHQQQNGLKSQFSTSKLSLRSRKSLRHRPSGSCSSYDAEKLANTLKLPSDSQQSQGNNASNDTYLRQTTAATSASGANTNASLEKQSQQQQYQPRLEKGTSNDNHNKGCCIIS